MPDKETRLSERKTWGGSPLRPQIRFKVTGLKQCHQCFRDKSLDESCFLNCRVLGMFRQLWVRFWSLKTHSNWKYRKAPVIFTLNGQHRWCSFQLAGMYPYQNKKNAVNPFFSESSKCSSWQPLLKVDSLVFKRPYRRLSEVSCLASAFLLFCYMGSDFG